MARRIILYALGLAAAAAALQWLQHRWLMRSFSTDIYIALLAIGFIGLGLWAGRKMTPPPPALAFERNDAALRSLGVTARECEILGLLASGQSNKALARTLGISSNTVKTHLARLYEKLDARNRVQAIEKARWLALIP